MKEEEISFVEIIEVVRKNITYFLASFSLCIFVGLLLCFVLKPKYKAQAKVFLQEKKAPTIFRDENNVAKPAIDYLQLIKGYDVVAGLVNRLKPEVPNEEKQELIKKFIKNIGLEKGKEGYYTVYFYSFVSAEDAKEKLSILLEEFLNYLINITKDNFSLTGNVYKSQIEKIKQEMDELSSKIKNFLEKEKIAELSEQRKSFIQQLTNLEEELSSTEVSIKEKQTNIDAIQKELVKFGVSIDKEDVLENKELKDLNEKLLSLANEEEKQKIMQEIEKIKYKQEQELSKKFRLQMLALPQFEKTLLENFIKLKIELNTLISKKQTLQEKIKEYNSILEKLPEKEFILANLQREYKMRELAYKSLMEKYADTLIASLSNDIQLKVIQPPSAEKTPVFPKKKIIIVLSTLLGVLLGFLTVFFKNLILQPLTTEEEIIEVDKDIVIVGKIHKIKQLKKLTDINISEIVENKQIMNSFNMLRNNIKYLYEEYPIIFGISSVLPKEGKSTIALLLVLSFFAKGKKVLICDFDFYKRQTIRFFSKYIEEAKKVIEETNYKILEIYRDALYILFPQTKEIEKLVKTIKQDLPKLKEIYDVIIFDTPPSLVSEKIYIFKELNLDLFLVVNLLETPKKLFEDTIKQTKNAKISLKGVILNKVSGLSYYPYYHYYRHYYVEEE